MVFNIFNVKEKWKGQTNCVYFLNVITTILSWQFMHVPHIQALTHPQNLVHAIRPFMHANVLQWVIQIKFDGNYIFVFFSEICSFEISSHANLVITWSLSCTARNRQIYTDILQSQFFCYRKISGLWALIGYQNLYECTF